MYKIDGECDRRSFYNVKIEILPFEFSRYRLGYKAGRMVENVMMSLRHLYRTRFRDSPTDELRLLFLP